MTARGAGSIAFARALRAGLDHETADHAARVAYQNQLRATARRTRSES